MSFINEKDIISTCTFPEKTFQMNCRVKHIIIITNYSVHPQRQIQTHFKRTHLPFLGLLPDSLPVISALRRPQLIDSVIDPVEMSPGVRTMYWITFGFVHKTQLLLGCNGHHFVFHSLFPQHFKSFLSHCSGNSLGSKIKNRLPFPFANSTNCRKYGRHSFSYTCRCLNKNLTTGSNCMVNTAHHLSLTFSVGKWKFQALKRMISLFLPFFLITEPFMIFIQKFLVPFFQFLYGDHLPEPFHHFCLQIGICHLDSNLRQAFLNTVNIAITHSLSLMNLHRLFHLFHISIYSFNLIDPDNFIFCKNSICTTF